MHSVGSHLLPHQRVRVLSAFVAGVCSMVGVCLAGSQPPPVVVPVPVDVTVGGEGASLAASFPATLVARLVDAETESSLLVTEKVSIGESELSLPLTQGKLWEIAIRAEGMWAAPSVILAAPGARARLEVFPIGTLRGGLQDKSALGPDELISVRVTTTPKEYGGASCSFPETVFPCQRDRGGFRCEVPATILDVRIGAKGRVPVYLWGLAVKPRGETSLGQVVLRRGASVSGMVDLGGMPSGTVAVELDGSFSAVARSGPAPPAQRLEKPDTRGFFIFEDVSPGEYEVKARGKDGRKTQAVSVSVSPGLESNITTALALSRPERLEVIVDPPRDWGDRPWTVIAIGDTERGGPSHFGVKGETDAAGRASLPGLLPGAYRLSVEDEEGGRWADERVDVAPDSPPVAITIEPIRVEGVLKIGDEPTEGIVRLTAGAKTVRFFAGDDGRFSGRLPTQGEWRITVELPEDHQFQEAGTAEITLPPGGGACWLDVELPGGSVTGEVVDEEGNPVVGATVELISLGTGRRSVGVSSSGGHFHLRGVPEQVGRVDASREGEVSDTVSVRVPHDGPAGPIRLVLHPFDELPGIVRWRTMPIAGARLRAMPDLSQGGHAVISDGVSGPDGRFRLALLGKTDLYHLLVVAPGFAARLLPIRLAPGLELVVELGRQSGTLIVSGSDPTSAARASGAVLVHNGAAFGLTNMSRTGIVAPDRSVAIPTLIVQGLEPGDYAVCSGNILAVFQLLRAGIMPPAEMCPAAYLAPGGTTTLIIPN